MCEPQKDSVAADSIHLRVEPEERSQLLPDDCETASQTQVFEINCLSRISSPLPFAEALNFASFVGESDWHFLCFINLSSAQIRQVRQAYHLHPLIDSECSPSVFNVKDSILQMPGSLLLTVSEIDEDYDHSIGLKIVVLSNILLLFASRFPACVSRLIKPERPTCELPDIEVPIEDTDCSEMHRVLYRIMEANTRRIEGFVLKIISEARLANVYASELSYHERVDFIQRINMVKKGIMLAQEGVQLKTKFFKAVLRSDQFPAGLRLYYYCLRSRNENMALRVASSEKLVQDAEHMYSATVDDTLANNAQKLNNIMKRYAAISVMYLPVDVIGTYFGMNVTVPWEGQGNVRAFSGISSFAFLIFLILGIFFRVKGWL